MWAVIWLRSVLMVLAFFVPPRRVISRPGIGELEGAQLRHGGGGALRFLGSGGVSAGGYLARQPADFLACCVRGSGAPWRPMVKRRDRPSAVRYSST